MFRADRRAGADGAYGTEFLAGGARHPVDLLNLERPDVVLALHRDYVAAGARVLRTNTFNAKPGLSDWRRVIREGVRLAREAAGAGVEVLGSIGSGEGVRAAAAALTEEGCAGVVLETFRDAERLASAVGEARAGGAFVVAALMAVTDPRSDLERAVSLLEASGAAALGINCMPPAEAGPVLERLRASTALPLWAFPSAGKPGACLGPDAWSGAVAGWKGLSVVGGCCGAGPDHIRALGEHKARRGTPGAR